MLKEVHSYQESRTVIATCYSIYLSQYFGPLHKLQGQKIDNVNKLITDNHFVLCFL